jgi:hypothetical protein
MEVRHVVDKLSGAALQQCSEVTDMLPQRPRNGICMTAEKRGPTKVKSYQAREDPTILMQEQMMPSKYKELRIFSVQTNLFSRHGRVSQTAPRRRTTRDRACCAPSPPNLHQPSTDSIKGAVDGKAEDGVV